jgi:predicted Holliday junction resolvase-like endonuclease
MLYAISIVPFVLYTFTVVAKFQIDKVYTRIHHLERKQQEQEAELGKAERRLVRQKTLLKQQEAELSEHNQELELVEDIMEDALEK